MKSDFSIILSIIALIGVISVWLLWLCDSIELSVIGLDTFIGVIVALLALIFTVTIGYQIINTIEFRREIMDLKTRQHIIETNYNNYIKLAQNLQSGICASNAQFQYEKGNYFEAFVSYNTALFFAIEADQPNQSNFINQLRLITVNISSPITNFDKGSQELILYTKKIKATTSYRNCLGSEYDKVMNDFWSKISQMGYKKPTDSL
ncbi:MAG: hypothetical protein K2H47_05275 [Muribaculaceae bacterium]|nr:hypothetical protein [Muribaculaceae bacterium]